MDYYKILGLSKHASEDDVKKAYRKYAFELHPDRNDSEDATKQFQLLVEAYAVLGNEERRKEYDTALIDLNISIRFTSNFDHDLDNLDKFHINIDDLSCSCAEWQEKKYFYSPHDPRRLCKHIIAKLPIAEISAQKFTYQNNEDDFYNEFSFMLNKIKLPNSLFVFEKYILDCRHSQKGFALDVELVSHNDYILLLKQYHVELIILNINSIFFQHAYYGIYKYNHYWSSYNHSNYCNVLDKYEHEKIYFEAGEFYQFKNNTEWIYKLRNNIKNSISSQSAKVDELWDNGYLLAQFFEYSLPFYCDSNYDYVCSKYLDFVTAKQSMLDKFDAVGKLLKMHNSNCPTMRFNKTLVEMGYLLKRENLNNKQWILIGDGLKYGINLVNDYSKVVHIRVPDWYVITMFDYETFTLNRETRYGLLKPTNVLFEKDKFASLLLAVDRFLSETMAIKEKPKNKTVKNLDGKTEYQKQKEVLREIELDGRACPYCTSRKIHKKDKRQRKNFIVQRWQCAECKKIFQEELQ